MKKNHALGIAAAVFLSAAAITLSGYPVQAAQPVKSQTTVYNDMTIGPVDVGGMTKAEAEQAVNEYVEGLLAKKITLSLQGSDEKKIEATIADMGFAWANPELLNGIGSIGKGGNIIRRYKMMKDMENTPISFEMEFSVDAAKIQALLEAKLPELEVAAVDAVLTRTEEGFSITPETVGITVDVPASVSIISEYLLEHWNYEDCAVSLMAATLYPNITKADCEKIGTEPMGEFMTTYYSSSEARSGNIDVAVSKINGSLLMPGERFSCLEHMIPFTAENGYFPAGSYLNGKLVDSFGGGVCQVSTTLYNAVLLAELEVNQRNNHGLTVGYVQLSADAAIAESSGMDFIFTNNTNAPVYIEGVTKGKEVTFRIYGMDERPDNRSIAFKNVVVEVLNPPEDVVTEDPALAAGVTEITQSSHTGYRAELYKHIYIDGVETSKEKVNSSYYAPAPNYVSVGPGTAMTEGEPEVPGAPVEGTIEDVPADVIPGDPAQQAGQTPDGNASAGQTPVEGETVLQYYGPGMAPSGAPGSLQ